MFRNNLMTDESDKSPIKQFHPFRSIVRPDQQKCSLDDVGRLDEDFCAFENNRHHEHHGSGKSNTYEISKTTIHRFPLFSKNFPQIHDLARNAHFCCLEHLVHSIASMEGKTSRRLATVPKDGENQPKKKRNHLMRNGLQPSQATVGIDSSS